jgi:hypothetical protein
MIERILFFLIICFLVPLKSLAQQDSLIQKPEKNVKILPLPMFWYTPETRFGFGVAAMVSFRFDKNNPNERVSSFQIGEAYTQEKQWINFSSFQLFPCKENSLFTVRPDIINTGIISSEQEIITRPKKTKTLI